MPERKLNFVKAGDNDASEVTISTGTHIAGTASPLARETYTISYPSGGAMVTPHLNEKAIREKFAAAAEELIKDAKARGVTNINHI